MQWEYFSLFYFPSFAVCILFVYLKPEIDIKPTMPSIASRAARAMGLVQNRDYEEK